MEKLEADMSTKGIILATEEWDRRIRNWLLAYGGEYDMETGELMIDANKVIHEPRKQFLT